MVRERRPGVVKEAREPKGCIQSQHRESGAVATGVVRQATGEPECRQTKPGDIYVNARPRRRQVWVLGEEFGVVCEMEDGRCGVESQNPWQRAAPKAGTHADGQCLACLLIAQFLVSNDAAGFATTWSIDRQKTRIFSSPVPADCTWRHAYEISRVRLNRYSV